MNREDIFKFINQYPEFYLATCEGNEPRVRGMRLYQADEKGIYFNTSKDKTLHRHLVNNPSVELCFYDGDCTQVRIRGKVRLTDDPLFKEQMAEKSPEMRTFIMQGQIATYLLTEPKARVWQMESDFTLRIMKNFERDSIWMAMYMGYEEKVGR